MESKEIKYPYFEKDGGWRSTLLDRERLLLLRFLAIDEDDKMHHIQFNFQPQCENNIKDSVFIAAADFESVNKGKVLGYPMTAEVISPKGLLWKATHDETMIKEAKQVRKREEKTEIEMRRAFVNA